MRNREIYNLGMVSGPVLLKIKREKLDFHMYGVNKKQKETEKKNEIGQILVSGALDDTKTIGKVGGNIFAKSGPEKPPTNRTIQDFLRDFPRCSCELSQKPVNSRTNGWAPYVKPEGT